MKIKLNKCYPVYSWHWDISNDELLCGICRVSFDGTCTTCKYPGDGCPLVIGECHHAFHMHCIWKWLEVDTAKGLCPMCRQVFNLDRNKEVGKGIVLPNGMAISGGTSNGNSRNANNILSGGNDNEINEFSIEEFDDVEDDDDYNGDQQGELSGVGGIGTTEAIEQDQSIETSSDLQ